MSQTLLATAESVLDVVESEPTSPPLGITGHYAYGGVGFEVLVEGAGPWQLNEDHLRYTAPPDTLGVCAQVKVAAAWDPALSSDEPHREILACFHGEAAEVRTREVRARLLRVRTGQYAASATVAPGAGSSLTTALVGAVVHDVGGLILHATGAIIDGAGVLFIGPSGAGKTTAVNHLDGCHVFARDRAAVYATASGQWLAWGMAGGDPVDLPSAPPGPIPLAAIVRVRHATSAPSIDDISGAKATSVLRESLQGIRGADEARVFGVLEELRGSMRVGVASTVIGRSLTSTLRAWLSS